MIPCWAPNTEQPAQKKTKKTKTQKERKPRKSNANRTMEQAIAAGGNKTGKPIKHWREGGPKKGQQVCPACTKYGRHKCGNPKPKGSGEDSWDAHVFTDPETGLPRVSGDIGCGPCYGPLGKPR